MAYETVGSALYCIRISTHSSDPLAAYMYTVHKIVTAVHAELCMHMYLCILSLSNSTNIFPCTGTVHAFFNRYVYKYVLLTDA